jgi:hypothetical protein
VDPNTARKVEPPRIKGVSTPQGESKMKIRSKLTGEISNCRGDIAKEMVKLGVAEFVEGAIENRPNKLPRPGDWKAPEPQWKVGVKRRADDVEILGIFLQVGAQQMAYYGPPAHVNAKVRSKGGTESFFSGFGRECPFSIVAEYERRWYADESLRGSAVRWRDSLVTNR